jgi:hypothetical protein
MLKIENLVATALTLGIPLTAADEMIIRWNMEKRMVQVIGL